MWVQHLVVCSFAVCGEMTRIFCPFSNWILGCFPVELRALYLFRSLVGCGICDIPAFNMKDISKLEAHKMYLLGVPWWLSGLGIQHGHCCGSGCCYGAGSIPGPGASTCAAAKKRKKRKKREALPSGSMHSSLGGLRGVGSAARLLKGCQAVPS